MNTKMDLRGQRFGRLAVLKEAGKNKYRNIVWFCLCDCGKELEVAAALLRRGGTTSCGCYQRDITKKRSLIHGKASSKEGRHPAYNTWSGLKKRCTCITTPKYPHYGGRGISYDPKWETFAGFWEDMGSTWEAGLSIDRIDNNGNYCKENCRWATPSEQARNRRTSRRITHNGETRTVAAWAETTKIPSTVFRRRVERGWSIEKAFETSVKRKM